ncbi:Aldo/keto reductase [Flagelloscypha sp. PMI_526]|nr:Aldo/keto reductase [Flagelloscypha sp. PMI_526]
MASNIPTFTLNNGVKIPSIGVGTWMGGYEGVEEEAYRTTLLALQNGYRYIDTASGYNTELAVGQAIKDSDVPREEIVVQTKLSPMAHGPRKVKESFEKSLELLGTGWIDVYLIHMPTALNEDWTPSDHPYTETWSQMEALLDTGKVKSIGISNFAIPLIEDLLASAKVVPALNQVELHPYLPSLELKTFCEQKHIHLQAWTPLGKGGDSPLLKDHVITSLAKKHSVTAAQIVLSWGVQRGTSVVPKSSNADRLKQNITLTVLTAEEMDAVTKIHVQDSKKHKSLFHVGAVTEKGGRINGVIPLEKFKWDPALYQ